MISETEADSTYFYKDGENFIIQQSILNQMSLLLLTAVLTCALLYLTFAYPEISFIDLRISDSHTIGIPIFVFFPLVLVAVIFFKLVNTRLVLSPEYLIYVDGILSWHERSIRLEYRKIQEIEIDQTKLQALFDIGDIIVTPISTGLEQSIRMNGIKNTRGIKDILREKMHPTSA